VEGRGEGGALSDHRTLLESETLKMKPFKAPAIACHLLPFAFWVRREFGALGTTRRMSETSFFIIILPVHHDTQDGPIILTTVT